MRKGTSSTFTSVALFVLTASASSVTLVSLLGCPAPAPTEETAEASVPNPVPLPDAIANNIAILQNGGKPPPYDAGGQ
jgi:hypothetical protein